MKSTSEFKTIDPTLMVTVSNLCRDMSNAILRDSEDDREFIENTKKLFKYIFKSKGCLKELLARFNAAIEEATLGEREKKSYLRLQPYLISMSLYPKKSIQSQLLIYFPKNNKKKHPIVEFIGAKKNLLRLSINICATSALAISQSEKTLAEMTSNMKIPLAEKNKNIAKLNYYTSTITEKMKNRLQNLSTWKLLQTKTLSLSELENNMIFKHTVLNRSWLLRLPRNIMIIKQLVSVFPNYKKDIMLITLNNKWLNNKKLFIEGNLKDLTEIFGDSLYSKNSISTAKSFCNALDSFAAGYFNKLSKNLAILRTISLGRHDPESTFHRVPKEVVRSIWNRAGFNASNRPMSSFALAEDFEKLAFNNALSYKGKLSI